MLKVDTLCKGLQRETGMPWDSANVKRSIANLLIKWNRYDSDEIISNLFSEECRADIAATVAAGKPLANAVYYAGKRQMIRHWKAQNAQKRGGVGAHKMDKETEEGEAPISYSTISLNSALSEDTTIEDTIGTDSEINANDAKDICRKIHNMLDPESQIVWAMMIQNRSCREIGNVIGKSHEMANRKMNAIRETVTKRKAMLLGKD